MKKHFLALAMGACLMVVTTVGCAKTNTQTKTSETTQTETTTTSSSSEELEAFSYDPSEYMVLGDYTGLTLDSPKTEVTDEVVEAQIEQNLLDNPITHIITDRSPEDEDGVIVDITSTLDGEEYNESGEDYELIVGEEYLGSEVDEALKKSSVGDTLTVKRVLPEDYEDDAGKTVEYTIKVKEIHEYEEVTELTEDYVKNTLNYDSVDAYKEAVKQQLLEETQENNNQTVMDNALSMILENSEIEKYPDELYEYYETQVQQFYEQFAASFGVEVSDLIADDELENAVVDCVESSMVIQAIAKKENLTITNDSYQKFLEENMDSDTYSSVEEFEEDYGKESLLEELQSQLVEDFLLTNNTLNEISQEEFDALYAETEETE